MKKAILACVAFIAYGASALFVSLGVMGSAVAAGTVSGVFNVQLIIGSGCAITGSTQSGTQNNFGSINFGNTSSTANIISGQLSGISINCTNSLAYTVALDNGLNVTSGTQRRMGSGSAYITYNLYQDAARSTLWTSAVNLTGAGTGAAVALPVYASVPTQTTPAAATYTDTVTMTITW